MFPDPFIPSIKTFKALSVMSVADCVVKIAPKQ